MTTTTVAPMTPAPTAAAPPRARRAWPYALIVPAVLFLAIAPTLTWLEFSSGSENLNVGTVLEMRRVDPVSGREGPWLVPTLKGAPRVIKPPLTAWVSAALVGPETVAALSHADPAARAAAYERLAWEVRWPALVLACASLAFVFELGRVLTGSVAGGVLAATVAGINLLFLRYGRSATTDVQLMLWVAVANACF
ncbi:MAG TPA: hypothetical protein VK324_15745, partial [Tepidisphaeraceae bacterium]|nr:hypothetical protein [Tepidisphaeraceae bacterium]